MTELPKTYLGDGVYASLNEGNMIVLQTTRDPDPTIRPGVHWIALEPEVFLELLRFARMINWGDIIDHHSKASGRLGDTDYTRAEEDAQRKRDAAEGFDD